MHPPPERQGPERYREHDPPASRRFRALASALPVVPRAEQVAV